MLVLGIESSCDESALALVADGRPLGSVLASQADVHALFGGVVPELASREHYRHLAALFDALLERTGVVPDEIDLVSVARGPGLLGSLLVGAAFAKGLALGIGARLLAVNHLHAHLLATGLDHELSFPFLGLLVSGGHTHLYRVESPWRFLPLGRTLDDAAGEAFDKVAKHLGLPYPGGALLDALARGGNAEGIPLPRPCLGSGSSNALDFSFSGLKTAAAAWIDANAEPSWRHSAQPDEAPRRLRDFCAAFNHAVVDTLIIKTERALDQHPDISTLVVAGGVAANSLLREKAGALMRRRGGQCLIPQPAHCTDNALMIAHAAWLLGKEGFAHDLSFEAIPRGRPIPDDMVRGEPPLPF